MSAATGTSSNFNVQAMPSLPSSCYPPSPSTADPCPPQPPPLSPGEIASIAVEGMTLVAIVSAATASVVLGAFWIRRRRKNNCVSVSKAQVCLHLSTVHSNTMHVYTMPLYIVLEEPCYYGIVQHLGYLCNSIIM